jgi:hypothetical protein
LKALKSLIYFIKLLLESLSVRVVHSHLTKALLHV